MKTWKPGMTAQEEADIGYWERNMLALLLANLMNRYANQLSNVSIGGPYPFPLPCGWYTHGEWIGWSRVISIDEGAYTFHVPDDFDMGDLPEIANNYDGHTTEDKWRLAMKVCGIVPKHDKSPL